MIIIDLLIVSASVSTIAITVTQSSLFSGLREKIKGTPFLGKILHCPYCFSHWVAFVAAIIISTSFIDIIINSFAIVCFASFFSIGINYYLEKVDHA